ncbi:alpha/beta-hydrolase [Zopfia rhizophila CBS 207.26]|uniref:Alpha/beta-hydrolase n=1 Tax=Zopfia rhizophila CBS 207.26 TaxID=1314779 RepID=A0A6A6E3L9_9PEZI|nr:alpha/beta-hydrolase [Zopfia rhizophila CBS 207.26]
MTALQTARTQYIDAANGIRFAYRWLGSAAGIPLVMHIHFRANMDFWDPLLINSLASGRPVIVFDQAGVGRSTGVIPTTYQGWADDLIAFINALGIKKFDLFGFSMGGAAAQMVALSAPNLVRKLILGGTAASIPSDSSDVAGIVWPRDTPPKEPIKVLSTSGNEPSDVQHAIAFSFFYDTDSGRVAAQSYWNRIHERNVASEPLLLDFVDAQGSMRQLEAFAHWSTPNPTNSFDRLGDLKMPVLVLNGDNDVLIPTSRSWEMAVKIPNAQLVIYPRAGHGFLYQHAELVAMHVKMFLDGFGGFDEAAKL